MLDARINGLLRPAEAGIFLLPLNRVGDGLDGAIARATAPTDRGGLLDFWVYVAFACLCLAPAASRILTGWRLLA